MFPIWTFRVRHWQRPPQSWRGKVTKVNWTSCYIGTSIPITMRFARNGGKILTGSPEGAARQTKYKFYM